MRSLSREEIVTIHVLSEKGVPARAVARTLGVTEGTVRYHRRRAREHAVDGRAKPHAAAALAHVVDRWRERHGDQARPGNVRELYEELVREHGYRCSYKSVVRYVRSRFGRPPLRTFRRVETPPGAQAQSDWGKWPRIDLRDGEGPRTVSAFVMVLSFSRMPAVAWSLAEDQTSWIASHNRCFTRLGGIPAVNRIDNTKAAIASGAGAWGTIHPVYASYARVVGFHVDACAPYEPQQKGKTEAKVRLCRSIFATLGQDFDGFDELQERTDQRIEHWSERAICPATGKSVRASWEAERDHLAPLPHLPEPFDVVVSRVVGRDATVSFEGRQYCVPFEHAGSTVEVRGCAGKVQIVGEGKVLREYPRGSEQRFCYDASCYEGRSTERVIAPPPLGRMGRRLQEIYEMPVERRPLDLYAALAEVAR
jgi:transposase